MAKNELKKAIVIATGKEVQVYRLNRGGWCNFADSKTEYKDSELRFI